jgi:2-polyprenyl-6-methoxyphenol hydroxylase-like FAD-dependent oxidoreductase
MEDAILLCRSIEATPDDLPSAFRRYERVRRERTSQIQGTSQRNTWMREATDPSWVYGYDAWTAPLEPAVSAA